MLDKLWKENLASLVYPNRCFLCQHILTSSAASAATSKSRHAYCQACEEEVCGDLIQRCYTCGAVTNVNNPFGECCRLCRQLNVRYQRAVAIGDYRGLLQQAVVQMKGQKSDVMAIQFGKLLADLFDKFEIPEDIDLIVPIPTHWTRRIQRSGFHASALIAEGIRRKTGWSLQGSVLKQQRRTTKQGTLSIRQRYQNLKGAYAINPRKSVQDMQILLVDDVMTSCATVSEATSVLLFAGASRVFVAVVARGARVS